MSAERDVNRIVRSWIRAEEHDSADRVLEIVLARLDTTPQRRPWWSSRRFAQMNRVFLSAGAAAAVLVVAIFAYNLLPGKLGPGGPSTPIPTATAIPSPTAAPTARTTASPLSPLEGTWATGENSCAEQDAAIEAAGFTAAEIALSGWTPTCPKREKVRFTGSRLVTFNLNGSVGWDGRFRIVDDQTFEAGDLADGLYYITYRYVIEGDVLTIDMIEDNYPATSEAGLLAEQIAQTVGWETSPFTRQP